MDFLKDLSIDKVRNLAEDAFNQAKPKSEVEAKVYEVLSHKNWGSSSTLMNEIARDTFDYDKFAVITQLMWEAMENQRPAAWRVVFKGLTLLEHLIKNGSERCVDDARNHGHTLRGLHQFNYYEGTVDRGVGVREKSKQIIDLLGDDDRIREERMRARKLREKFGSAGATASGGGGKYEGYGNDSWGNSGGGYGDGGIGSRSGGGGRYDEDRGGNSGYSGRYDDQRSPAAPVSATPTFASLPEDTKKTKAKKTKKKKKEELAAAPAPAPPVDLFSFDAGSPAPAATSEPTSEDFAAFQSAGSAPAAANDPFAAAPASAQSDEFSAFAAASPAAAFAPPPPPAPQQNNQFGAFDGPTPTSPTQANQFGAFGNMSGGVMNGSQTVMGNSSMMGGSNNDSFGNFASTGGSNSQPAAGADDDFGDFAGASSPTKSASGPAVTATSTDPMSKLISLDGLTKNQPKKTDRMYEPVIANSAAASFVYQKDTIQQNIQQGKKGNMSSFDGIDGLNKPSGMSGGMGVGLGQMGGMSANPSVMSSSATGADAISMLDPKLMQPQQQQQQKPQGGMQMTPQMMAMMQQQMMANPQMMAQMMARQQMMMNQQQGGMQSGMQMTPQQQQMMMMMMKQQQHGMQGNNMGMPGGMNQMGGFR